MSNKKAWVGRGGKRDNQTGRPKRTGAPPTKVVRIPSNLDSDALISLHDDLETLVQAWRQELTDPEKASSPRYDKAQTLLGELENLLQTVKQAN